MRKRAGQRGLPRHEGLPGLLISAQFDSCRRIVTDRADRVAAEKIHGRADGLPLRRPDRAVPVDRPI